MRLVLWRRPPWRTSEDRGGDARTRKRIPVTDRRTGLALDLSRLCLLYPQGSRILQASVSLSVQVALGITMPGTLPGA